MENEIWKDVVGYEGWYQVSNLGRVKSLPRQVIHGESIVNRSSKMLKQTINHKGYLMVTLCRNRHRKSFTTHRLVAEAFIPNPYNKPEVDHINTVKDDNRVENLRWATTWENIHNPISFDKLKRIPVKGINIITGETILLNSAYEGRKYGFHARLILNCARGLVPQHKKYKWYAV